MRDPSVEVLRLADAKMPSFSCVKIVKNRVLHLLSTASGQELISSVGFLCHRTLLKCCAKCVLRGTLKWMIAFPFKIYH